MSPNDLRQWRHRLRLSQPQAARVLRVPLATLRNWEQGRNEPHPLLDVATAYVERYGPLPEDAPCRIP